MVQLPQLVLKPVRQEILLHLVLLVVLQLLRHQALDQPFVYAVLLLLERFLEPQVSHLVLGNRLGFKHLLGEQGRLEKQVQPLEWVLRVEGLDVVRVLFTSVGVVRVEHLPSLELEEKLLGLR